MQPEFLAALYFLGLFLLLVIITQVLYNLLKLKAETSRKFLHVGGGILALCLPLFIRSHWTVLILCSLAFILLLVTYIKRLLPSVHATNRMSVGSVVFPIPVYICFYVAFNYHYDLLYYVPVSILTIPDAIAEWSGRRWGHLGRNYFNGQKTLAGSLGFAISCLPVCLFWFLQAHELSTVQVIVVSVVITIIATLIELISLKGYDNLSVPLVVLVVLWFYLIS